MYKYFQKDTIDELIVEYIQPHALKLSRLLIEARRLGALETYARRPFPFVTVGLYSQNTKLSIIADLIKCDLLQHRRLGGVRQVTAANNRRATSQESIHMIERLHENVCVCIDVE